MEAPRTNQTLNASAPVGGPLALGLKGLLMGTADIIPGVSGGTVALIVGVYGRLLEAIRSITPVTVWALLRALPGLWSKAKRPALVAAAKAVHLDFLVPLGAGIVGAILVSARIIPVLLERYPAQMNGLFFGLITASVYVPWSKMPRRRVQHLLALLAAAVFAYWLVGLPMLQGTDDPSLLFVFVAGAIAICAMILPGISGSYMLKAMGLYAFILSALNERNLAVIGVFLLGITLGITSFARVLSWLLRHFEAMTLAVLTGLMVGSLRSVWPFREQLADGTSQLLLPAAFGANELTIFALMLLGLAVVGGLIFADRKLGAAVSPASGNPPVAGE